LTYVQIPAGKFTMGCSPDDKECDPNEKPAHEVTISKNLWIGQTPVTQEAYRRVTRTNYSNRFKGPRLPVDSVSWVEAVAYCTAVGMRLPTEAQWEYAACAGSTAARYGDLDNIAWYSRNSGGKTHEVGQKQANGFGLFDMLGNVWEWVADWYDGNYYGQSPAVDPSGPASDQFPVLRGGLWNDGPKGVRASARVSSEQTLRIAGFRCAGELP
jgi:formylglycine-generating enzyme required for sulfatase activity